MRWVVVTCAALSGCSALFDLNEPIRRDASVGEDAADAALDGPPDAPGITIDAPGCPMTYTLTGTTHYRVVTTSAGWTAAAADCADDGATTHLAVVSSDAELLLVSDTFDTENELWIGLSDLVTDGTFLWVTAEDTMGYPPASGAPWQTTPGSDPCVLLKLSDGFNTRDCNLTRRYVCECDAFADDPARY